MRQIWIPRPGLPEVLELREARDPIPATGKVRICVEACGVNFADIIPLHPLRLIQDKKRVFGVNVGHLWAEVDRVASWMESLLGLYREGHMRPVVAARFPFDRAAEAHRSIQDRRNVGKVLLVP